MTDSTGPTPAQVGKSQPDPTPPEPGYTTWHLDFEDIGDSGVPVARRVAALLKVALRRFRLRNVTTPKSHAAAVEALRQEGPTP